MSPEAVLQGLQRELDEKHTQVVRLLSEVEDQKLKALRQEEELALAGQRSQQDQEALGEAREQKKFLEEQQREALTRLQREEQRRKSQEEEKERLEEEKERLEEEKERLKEEKERLEERVVRQGERRDREAADSQNRGGPTDRTRDWVFQQKSGDAALTVNSSTPSLPEVTGTRNATTPSLLEVTGTGNAALHHDPSRPNDRVLVKLLLLSAEVKAMVSRGSGRLTTEVDSEALSWLQSNIDDVISMLRQSPALPSAPESTALLVGGSSSLSERLLRQNAELTGFVSRLTEEKNDLRNQTLRLEEERRRYRGGPGAADSSSRSPLVDRQEAASALFSSERQAWIRERSRLEKTLRLAQAEVARLRGEIRTEALGDTAGPEADNAALKRMYGRYLRSESFRKALIYQKKYLLLLLGGFQECEEATLSLISRMGVRPSPSPLSPHRRGLTRFRSAVRVSIALSRMRFLVKRWQKATGVGSSSANVNRNGLGQTPGNEVRTESPYLHPGSVEVYGGRGASRGRTGRDSPRSALSSTQHRFPVPGEAGLTCSHLQNYDPDRALTDYISRLEALQRRLGSVQSGSSSYAQLHFGIRR